MHRYAVHALQEHCIFESSGLDHLAVNTILSLSFRYSTYGREVIFALFMDNLSQLRSSQFMASVLQRSSISDTRCECVTYSLHMAQYLGSLAHRRMINLGRQIGARTPSSMTRRDLVSGTTFKRTMATNNGAGRRTTFSISKGEDTEKVTADANDLVGNGRWTVTDEGRGIERVFKFKTFKATWVCVMSRFSFQSIFFS